MKFSELMARLERRGVKVLELRPGGDPDVAGVCDDSRKVKAGDLFVARAGVKADGAKFVTDALARGAVAVVGEMPLDLSGAGSAAVADAHFAGAILAHVIAGNPTAAMKVIGVTGTKGKTTVAYLLRSVLKAAGHKVGMIGTVEIDDGVEAVPADMTTPGSVELAALFSRMKANGVTHCVMEVSSHALHQHRVAGIDFAVAIFTNLTGDHLDYHKTMEEYAAAKAMLFEGLRDTALAVVNADDAWAEQMVSRCKAPVISYHLGGKDGQLGTPYWAVDDWVIGIGRMTSQGMGLLGAGADLIWNVQTPLVGQHNAYNLAAVLVAAYSLGLPGSTIVETLNSATGAPGRLQAVVPAGTGRDELPFQVFVDYAHTHDALENVLTALRATMAAKEGGTGSDTVENIGGTPMPRRRLICVFGCGGDRDRTKRPKMGRIAQTLADRVFVTSDNPRTENPAAIIDEICAGFSTGWQKGGKIVVEPDRRAAIRTAIAGARDGDVVLIAGKGHENYQIIGTTKHHFDDVEEAQAALQNALV